MSTNNLDTVALGYDEAKVAVYAIMKKYFPKIEQSRSSLLNAFISGMSYLYAMFQTFVRLIQNEMYVSQATELESLYKLVPFVGIKLYQPTTLKIEGSLAIQNEAMTADTDPELYLTGTDPFSDTNGNKFYLRTQSYLNKKVFEFDNSVYGFRTTVSGGLTLTLSLSKFLDEMIPVSFYNVDDLVVEAPYYLITSATSKKLKVRFNKTGIATDAGSDNPAQVDLANCYCNYNTGHILLKILTGTFDDANLDTLPVNVTYKVRSVFKKDIDRAATAVAGILGSAAYTAANIWGNACLQGIPASGSLVDFARIAAGLNDSTQLVTTFVNEGIKVDSLVLTNVTDSSMEFDFSNATELQDVFWGTIYKTTCVFNSNTYVAYILDKWTGLVAFEDIEAVEGGVGTSYNWTQTYTTTMNSKAMLDQYEEKLKVFAPPSDMDFDSYSFELEDEDPILFDDIAIQINDTGYTGTTFTQVDSLVTVEGDTTASYFEVIVLSPTKIKLKFESVIPWDTLESVSISYQTVKQLTSYDAGNIASGSSQLEDVNQVVHNVAGVTSFGFDATNTTSQAGVAGIPTLESLRSMLEKASYTLTNIVNQTNYEAALQAYYVSLGYDALVKVFKYEDFGTLFVNWTKGNVVYFIGLLNKYPNSNYVVTVPSELAATYTGTGHQGQYTRAELAASLAETLTDVSLTYVNTISDTDADTLNDQLRGDMVLTNYLLAAQDFILMYAVYFKVKIRPKDGYTFTEAEAEVKSAIASLFSWDDMSFVRDINVSDLYRICDNLPSVDKLLFTNFSHYKNDGTDGALRVQDITYKTITQTINTTVKMKATSSALTPKFSLRNVTSTNGNKFTAVAATNRITAAAGTFANTGIGRDFIVGDHVNVSGFSTAGNNGTTINVTNVDPAGAWIALDPADITLTNENNVIGVLVRDATSLATLGMTTGRRISITGFSNPENNVTNAQILAADTLEITMDPAEVSIVSENYASVTVDADQERFSNPLWDFTTVVTNAKIRIDVLALGGIETEQY